MFKLDAATERLLPGEQADRITFTRTHDGFSLSLVGFGRRLLVDATLPGARLARPEVRD